MLSCEIYLQRMEAAVEEKSSLPGDVRTHLAQCSSIDCQNALLEYELLATAIPVWRDSLPEIDLTQQVVGEFSAARVVVQTHSTSQQKKTPQRTHRSPMAAIFTVVGTLSLCLIGLLQVIPTNSTKTGLITVQVEDKNSESLIPHDSTDDQIVMSEDTEVEAELRQFGSAYGSWMQGATNKLTDTVSVVLLEEQSSAESSGSWFSELTDQIEQPFESTLKYLIEESSPAEDEQTLFDRQNQNEYFGFLWSKSESLKPLFTLMFV